MKDFEDEVPGYLQNEQIARTLDALTLRPGPDAVTDNLVRCYEALVSTHVLKPDEMPLASRLDRRLRDPRGTHQSLRIKGAVPLRDNGALLGQS